MEPVLTSHFKTRTIRGSFATEKMINEHLLDSNSQDAIKCQRTGLRPTHNGD